MNSSFDTLDTSANLQQAYQIIPRIKVPIERLKLEADPLVNEFLKINDIRLEQVTNAYLASWPRLGPQTLYIEYVTSDGIQTTIISPEEMNMLQQLLEESEAEEEAQKRQPSQPIQRQKSSHGSLSYSPQNSLKIQEPSRSLILYQQSSSNYAVINNQMYESFDETLINQKKNIEGSEGNNFPESFVDIDTNKPKVRMQTDRPNEPEFEQESPSPEESENSDSRRSNKKLSLQKSFNIAVSRPGQDKKQRNSNLTASEQFQSSRKRTETKVQQPQQQKEDQPKVVPSGEDKQFHQKIETQSRQLPITEVNKQDSTQKKKSSINLEELD